MKACSRHPRLPVCRRGWLATILTVATQVGIGLPALKACECGPTPPPCQAYWQSQMVFLGTVTEVLPSSDARISRFRMIIDRAYKGISEKQLILFDDGMCDGPYLLVGEQYLMYTQRFGEGDVPARGCTHSRHLKSAEEDLAYLERLENAQPVARVFGRVEFWPDEPGKAEPMASASVHLNSGDTETSTVTADGQGQYSFDGLNGGKYTVSAEIAGYHMPEHDYGMFSATVEPRGCAQIDVKLKRNWPGNISGRLIRSEGTPAAAGIDLRLIRLPDSEDGSENPLAGEVNTNEHGEYAFEHLPPGKYKVVVHWCCFPVVEVPYPAIYWPVGKSEEEGWVIVVGKAAGTQHCDFLLPPEVRSTTVSGQVLMSDGKPASGTKVWLLKLPEGENSDEENRCCDFVDAMDVGADGRFSFKILEGVKYTLATSVDGGRLETDHAPISFGNSQTPIVLKLGGLTTTDKDKR
jgi:hypothetical protein